MYQLSSFISLSVAVCAENSVLPSIILRSSQYLIGKKMKSALIKVGKNISRYKKVGSKKVIAIRKKIRPLQDVQPNGSIIHNDKLPCMKGQNELRTTAHLQLKYFQIVKILIKIRKLRKSLALKGSKAII